MHHHFCSSPSHWLWCWALLLALAAALVGTAGATVVRRSDALQTLHGLEDGEADERLLVPVETLFLDRRTSGGRQAAGSHYSPSSSSSSAWGVEAWLGLRSGGQGGSLSPSERGEGRRQRARAVEPPACWPEGPVDLPGNIPKRIIQTWKTHRPRGRLRRFLERTQELNPDFEFLLLDDNELDGFVRTHFPRLRYMWAHLVGPFRVQRYDLFRMLAVYHFGGFYLDMDVELERGLAPLLEHEAVFPHEEFIPVHVCQKQTRYGRWPFASIDCSREFPQLGQFAFGARAGHPFIKRVIEAMYRQFLTPDAPVRFSDIYVFTTGGPDLVSHVYNTSSSELQAQVTVLYPEPYAKFRFGNYGRHHMDGSWRKRG